MGGDVEDEITAEEFADWVPVSQALAIVAKAVGLSTAPTTILERLVRGLMRGAAEDAVITDDGKTLPMTSLLPIPIWAWKVLADGGGYVALKLWKDGSQKMEANDYSYGRRRATSIEAFGVRIERAGLLKIPGVVFPNRPSASPASTVPEIAAPPPEILQSKLPVVRLNQTEDEPPQKGPSVPAAALEAWYAAYKMAFSGIADTEAKALESARGCFPGKSIARDAVRALRGTLKRGPKPKAAK
jgi:hypothetical protein